MRDWRDGLDRYLTSSPPSDGYDEWCEEVLGKHIDDFIYQEHEEWFMDYNGLCDRWLNKLFFKKCLPPQEAAKIIERAVKLYKL